MVKKYSKISKSLSNTKRGGVFPSIPSQGIFNPIDDKLKPAGDAAIKIKDNLKQIKREAKLDDIKKLEILKDFNTKFIGYLREKAKESDNNEFKELFDGNSDGKINDLKYSRLINGKKLNNQNFPTNNQINTLKNNQTIKNKVCQNKKQNNGLVTAGTNKGAEGNPVVNAAAQSGPTTSSKNNNHNEGRLRTSIDQKINNISRYENSLEQNKKMIFDNLKQNFASTKNGNKIQTHQNAKARQILIKLNNLIRNTKPSTPPPPPQAAAQTAQTAVSGGKKSTSSKKKSTSTSTKKKSTSTSTKKKSTSTSTKKKSTSTSSKKKSTKK